MCVSLSLAAGSLVLPLASPPPTLLPVGCVISLAAALLANANPFIFPPVHEFWLSGQHKLKGGLLFCKQAATRTTWAVYASHPPQDGSRPFPTLGLELSPFYLTARWVFSFSLFTSNHMP